MPDFFCFFRCSSLFDQIFLYSISKFNFIFAGHPLIDGAVLYEKLREKGILVRHFGTERIKDFNRISVGTDDQMDILLNELTKILAEEK